MGLKLDPKGYFLIKLENNKIHLAFCKYQNKKGWYEKHNIKLSKSGNKQELLDWATHHRLFSQEDHYDYLVKELNKAERCLKDNKKYVQE